MGRVDRYILRQILPIMFVTLFISVVVLLLEKMLNLLDLTVGSGVSSLVVFQMIVTLFPNYIRLVLPLGLFLGVFITFRRLSTQYELQAFYSGGTSLRELSAPVRSLALLLTVVGIALTGYMEPGSRYIFNSLQHQITNGIIEAGVGEGIFIDTPNGFTVRVDRSLKGGTEFYGFFGYREREDGELQTITARRGEILEKAQSDERTLILFDGEQVSWSSDSLKKTEVGFSTLEVQMDLRGANPYPERGTDELELTLHELIAAYSRALMRDLDRDPGPTTSPVLVLADGISFSALAAELHGRLTYAFSIIIMPFFAIPLAIGTPRSNRNIGLVMGLVGLLGYQKSLEFGQKVASISQLPAGPFLWGIFAIFLGLSVYFFKATDQAAGRTPFQDFEKALRRKLGLQGSKHRPA